VKDSFHARYGAIGTHNFTSFSNEAYTGTASRNPIRHLKRLDCIAVPDWKYLIVWHFTGLKMAPWDVAFWFK
jgi:tRNA U38,U39,U40 pseudouridine synthase TruA